MWYFVCFLFLFFSLCAYISILNMLFFSVVAFVFRLLGSLYQQVISDRIRGVLFPSLRTSTVELCSIVCVCMYQARLEQLSTQRFCQSFILFARWHQLFAKKNVLLFFFESFAEKFSRTYFDSRKWRHSFVSWMDLLQGWWKCGGLSYCSRHILFCIVLQDVTAHFDIGAFIAN